MAITLKNKILFNVVPFLIRLLLIPLGMSMKLKEYGNIEASPHQKKGRVFIYAFWHSRILMSVYFYRKKNINVLVSMNKDGEYISRTINMFGFGSTRGSSSREGFRAFLGLKKVLAEGFNVAITPDGPRGPKQKAQMGAVYLSKITGIPVAPFSFDASAKKTLSSWDNFIIPKPFSRGAFVWGKLIHVPKNADEKTLEQKRVELEKELNRITGEAEELCAK